ncbi:polysialyltransferase family glycosyltransferase [Vibrio hepatarius]|uniref:Lipooligosaccharide sialyltransferase n=1 Tax=Vibrio hepatarius TaxID=171383 RepID=A0A0M0HX71_9VIBR|nr:polysialyltransferase family glycosyltransferase [Vibrio hepatarius]KOO06686.1 hypothetical protein AKJ31_15540 [Vibrio hepatarius]
MEIAHLCITYNHLLYALSSAIIKNKARHTIYMPTDYQFVPESTRINLVNTFPEVKFVFEEESFFLEEFMTMPSFFPSIVKRNLSIQKYRFIRPFSWKGSLLSKPFSLLYIYHSGPFLAKVLAGNSKKTILRGDGFANYKERKIGVLKGSIRFAFGLPFSKQVWGEEPWVDEIEVVDPSLLPNNVVKNKSSKLDIGSIVKVCNEDHFKRAIIDCFSLNILPNSDFESSVLFLTQPLDTAKLCSTEDMHRINNLVIDFFVQRGLTVYIKQHPREDYKTYKNTLELSRSAPIEIYSLLGVKFAYAVSLHSAGIQDEFIIAKIQKNLVPLCDFHAESFHLWKGFVDKNLNEIFRTSN